MPRVKIDYVVSFSSEDPENQANNLLAKEVSKKKWLCNAGEPSCSVVLQLSRAVQISTVHIGACNAALVEVLVGRSENPNDQFEVLVPSSVFLSPLESRRGEAGERVRSFAGAQLGARAGRWDRVRVVCSQPYNKHCKYGLSFIHIFEPEDKPEEPKLDSTPVAAAVPPRLLALDNFSSDEDEFKPGEMFAKHLNTSSEQGTSGNTGAQIRQATSQALKNISDSSTRLVKTPIAKANTNRASQSADFNTNRQKDTLMYTDEDELPHTKIDKIVQRHKDDKEQEIKKKEQKQHEIKKKEPPKNDKLDNSSRAFKDFIDNVDDKRKDLNTSRRKDDEGTSSRKKTDDSNQHNIKDRKRHGGSQDRDRDNKKHGGNQDKDRDRERRKKDNDSLNKDRDSRKRAHSDGKEKDKGELRPGPVSAAPHTLLSGAVFALSGYENPRRARLRDAAVALGARFQRDWSPACTHLICAFPNTPKLKAVRASAQNDACVAVLGEWVEQCCDKRRLLPWQWFATEPKKRVTPPENYDDDEKADSECDTDDEIEKVLRKQKKQRTDKSPSKPTERDKSPRPQTSKERSPKPHTSRDRSPKPHTSREKSPKPHSSRERSPKPHTSKERSPKPHTSRNKSPKPHTSRESLNFSIASTDSDVAFVKDERIQANIALDSDNETDEEKPAAKEKVDKKSSLPDFFEGYTFVIDEGVEEAGFDKELLSRYVRAYGGVIMDASLLDSDSEVSFVLGTDSRGQGGGKRVRADWVWRCHENKRLCDVTEYAL